MELTYTQREDLKNNIAPTPKKQNKKTNKDFQKIFYDKIDYLIQLNKKSPAALNVYLLLIKYADTNNTVYLTVNMIKDTLHICKQTVISAIELLQQDGYMTTYKVGRTSFYFLNPDISVSCQVGFQRKICEAYNVKVQAELNDYNIIAKDLEGLEDLDPVKDKDYIEEIKEIKESIKKVKKPANFLCDIDVEKVDSSIIDKTDRIRIKTAFFKQHPELQPPTEEELKKQEEDDKWNDDNLTPYGELNAHAKAIYGFTD